MVEAAHQEWAIYGNMISHSKRHLPHWKPRTLISINVSKINLLIYETVGSIKFEEKTTDLLDIIAAQKLLLLL